MLPFFAEQVRFHTPYVSRIWDWFECVWLVDFLENVNPNLEFDCVSLRDSECWEPWCTSKWLSYPILCMWCTTAKSGSIWMKSQKPESLHDWDVFLLVSFDCKRWHRFEVVAYSCASITRKGCGQGYWSTSIIIAIESNHETCPLTSSPLWDCLLNVLWTMDIHDLYSSTFFLGIWMSHFICECDCAENATAVGGILNQGWYRECKYMCMEFQRDVVCPKTGHLMCELLVDYCQAQHIPFDFYVAKLPLNIRSSSNINWTLQRLLRCSCGNL